jgi:Fur family transcriptional regulator, ferric uptake regulator
MTLAHRSTPLVAANVDDAMRLLREHGLRGSTARRLVLEMLFARAEPSSAEEIAAGIAGRVPRSDLTSVYRNLETLEEVGLVRHVHLGHAPGLYALAGTAREYLVCESCGHVRAVESRELDEVRNMIRDAFGWEAKFGHFPIAGLCKKCARGDRTRRESGRARR